MQAGYITLQFFSVVVTNERFYQRHHLKIQFDIDEYCCFLYYFVYTEIRFFLILTNKKILTNYRHEKSQKMSFWLVFKNCKKCEIKWNENFQLLILFSIWLTTSLGYTYPRTLLLRFAWWFRLWVLPKYSEVFVIIMLKIH